MFSFATFIYAVFLHLIHMGAQTVLLHLGDRKTKQDIFKKMKCKMGTSPGMLLWPLRSHGDSELTQVPLNRPVPSSE